MTAKAVIRQRIIQQRKTLPKQAYLFNNARLVKLLNNLVEIKKARHIGLYLPFKNEIDATALTRSPSTQCHFYVPKIVKHAKKLIFTRLPSSYSRLHTNRYGITEMSRGVIRSAKQLDVVLVPLVAFDQEGRRLGMGGGYYDTTFAFKNLQHKPRKPCLIGLAHSFQEIASVPVDFWDISLDAIITEKKILYVKQKFS